MKNHTTQKQESPFPPGVLYPRTLKHPQGSSAVDSTPKPNLCLPKITRERKRKRGNFFEEEKKLSLAIRKRIQPVENPGSLLMGLAASYREHSPPDGSIGPRMLQPATSGQTG
ncbi:uncharacterized protein LOC125612955 isoform X2 [Marmota marmota marmota]|uniref:uncharacterized protein LOC125612955 isoform X2 n=1 Tax=Marmota marmota marmota TaxID=9994 RepID=UPI0020936932|nr:uncharacterized protein LOC125612955 isoform X2 [Marmota marmota marmota]